MLSIRKIGVFGRTYRHLNRYRQILTILFRYGFGDLVETLNIDQYIEIGLQVISKKPRRRLEKISRARRVRMIFEELGSTFIKLGQVLSARPDLIAPDFIKELSQLQDDVPPFGFAAAREIIESELKKPLTSLFESIEAVPLASASIAQVHKARLPDGEVVAVKVQRPGIRKMVEVDIEIMLHLATLAERHVAELSFHQPVRIVQEFAKTLEKELDFTIEAVSMERVARNFLSDATLYVPKVYQELTTDRILVIEHVDGIKISKIEQLDQSGCDRRTITRRGADILLRQIFDHGFFHADPHPGNIFVLPQNVICLLDFGMVGTVDRGTREDFVELVDSVLNQDESRTVNVLLRLTSWEKEPDLRELKKDVSAFIGQHLYKTLKEIELGKLLHQLLEISSVHQLRIYPDIFLMMKAIVTVEGVARYLDPDFDMLEQAAPFIRRVKLARFTPKRIERDLADIAGQALRFIKDFPGDILEITRLIKQRNLSLRHNVEGLDKMLHTHDQISNRIAFAIIIGALIIGSAMIVISNTPPLFYGISLIGIIGFLAAAVMGVWLLIAIIKKGRL